MGGGNLLALLLDRADRSAGVGAPMMPYFQDEHVTIYHGDCRDILPSIETVDVVITDPPYGDTSLEWDVKVDGWLPLLPTNNLWCFGSMRFFMDEKFEGWMYAQEIVWEKHNGSSFHADRFKRVHEFVTQFYQGEWGDIFKKPVLTADKTARTIRRKSRPAHTGHIEDSQYVSDDGGPRMQRSVIQMRSAHGYAEHPTQKPVGIVVPLIQYSLPDSGVVLDPFMGSGTTLRAAKDLNRKAVGIEIEEKYCEIAANRMAQIAMELEPSTEVPL